MKTRLTVLAGVALALASVPAWADRPLKDYSFIRGVNYGITPIRPFWNATSGTPSG